MSSIGWVENDLIVRRLLVSRLRRLLRYDPEGVVAQDEIEAFLAATGDSQMGSTTIDFEHVFLGERLPDASVQALRPKAGSATADLEALSRPFPLGLEFRAQPTQRVSVRFGEAFTSALLAAPERAWLGPIESNYGWHFVRVKAVRQGVPPTKASERERAVRAISRRHAEERLQRHLKQLSERYRIEVEDPAWEAQPGQRRGSRRS